MLVFAPAAVLAKSMWMSPCWSENKGQRLQSLYAFGGRDSTPHNIYHKPPIHADIDISSQVLVDIYQKEDWKLFDLTKFFSMLV